MKKIIKRWLTEVLDNDKTFKYHEIKIQELHRQVASQKKLHEIQNKINQGLTPVLDELTDRLKKQEALMAHTRSLINVGVDVSLPNRGRSWAVICIQGARDGYPEIVKFMELEFEHIQELYKILKQFEGCNVKQDFPRGIPTAWIKGPKGF